MKRTIAVIAVLALAVLAGCQKTQLSSAQQEKLAALKQLRDTGVITAQEYETKVQALEATAPAASGDLQEKISALKKLRDSGVLTEQEYESKLQMVEAGARAPEAASVKTSVSGGAKSGTRQVEVNDPVYRMTAYTLEIPADWKYAGDIARVGGCHSNGAALRYTAQSPDGWTAVAVLPGVAWSWSTSASRQKIMESSHCPGIDIGSAAGFLVNIAVPNVRPNAKIAAVLPLLPEGQAALADQLKKERDQNAAMAQQYGQKPQKLTLDGARVRVQYEREGHPVEEMITAVIDCNESTMPALYNQPAYQQRACFSRGTVIARAPQGQLDALLAGPQLKALSASVKVNPDWQNRLTRDQQAAFQKAQAENNRQFQALMQKGRDDNDRLLANGRAFQQRQRESTDRALAADRAKQNAIDASAHATALYSLDRQEFRNPNTGQVIEASNQYNHQWISSDGSTLIQTNDHTFDPNGVVNPVSTSWTELVVK